MALHPILRMNPFSNTSFNNIDPAPSIIDVIQRESQNTLVHTKEYFPGACYTCGAMPSLTGVPVMWCTGCQLVAYCNTKCQRADWKSHKIVCKAYPADMGKNIIVKKTELVRNDTYSFGLAMEEMYQSVDNLHALKEYTYAVRSIFLNPRMCMICREARKEKLFDCRCCFYSYCSESHRKMDIKHLNENCDILYKHAMGNWYLTQYRQLLIPDGLLNEANLYDGIKFEKVSKLSKYSSEKWLEAIVHLINNSLTFLLTIFHAIKNLKLGKQRKSLSEITSLTIHIVHDSPMLDPRLWEFMLHQLPHLKTLNITFINRLMILCNQYNTNLPLERCSDCKIKQRVINYNIQHMHYHEYFSSDEYDQPDIVAVFDASTNVMAERTFKGENIEKVERFTSEGNMTYSEHTVVILADHDENALEDCVKSFHDARPVKVLLQVQENPAARSSSVGFVKKKIVNQCRYLCCFQGNH